MFKASANSASSSENAKSFASYPMVLICRPEKSAAIHVESDVTSCWITCDICLRMLCPAAGVRIAGSKANSASSSENAKSFASYPMVLICRPEKSGISMKAG
jgi:hypothetical protein